MEDAMITARELVRKKGDVVFSVPPDATVYEAMRIMAEKNLGSLMVLNDNEVVGILSERDCARKVELKGKSVRNTHVEEIMTEKVLYVEADQKIEEVMALMNEKNVRHIPVIENGKLLGVLSMRDVLREVINQQNFLISQLEHYITGGKG
jgi:CBS domain-containing protein